VRQLGAKLTERLADLEAGRIIPAPPRDAATVMVLRSTPDTMAPFAIGRDTQGIGRDIQVLMLRRTAAMKFAPGAYVFPGGSVDPADYDGEIGWQGPSPAEFGARLGASAEVARALVCAAVRETFEESGVLLAGESADSVVADTTSEDWERDRNALLDRSLSLAELLAARRLVLRSDLLRPWARWITPVVEPRRYDTRFFAAALPAGQRTRDVSTEAAAVTWIEPTQAIEAGKRGEIQLWPPTAVTLAELAACGDLPTALTGPRDVATRIPEVLTREGATWLTVPGVAEYPI
jgi:8-oxo-dGTP pyrophosphatase MutT (NUDIX family)